jgi:threonylcarbamoyladenosine tRNA methylthiotransferase CDKAL1
MRFHIETYGCTSNQGNSSQAAAALISLGHVPSSIEEADATIINTCAVTEKTERKILKRLRQLQGDRLIIAGCLPSAIPGSVEGICCRIKLGLLNKSAAVQISDSFDPEICGQAVQKTRLEPMPAPDNLCGIINIAEGCQGECSYCIVRRARGRLVSLEAEEIVRIARTMIQSGIVELQLAAQDTAAWGMDIGSSLPELLAGIVEIPGRFMVRVGMMNPNTLQPILREMAHALESPKIYKFVHMPVQSGSDEILEKMRRGYTANNYLEMVRYLREKSPEMSFATDVIAGFPGETEEDFARTFKLMELTRPDKINITRYSQRPTTPASKLYDMPDRIKKERSRRLTKLWLDISGENNRRYLGKVLTALVTERGRGRTMKGRTENYTGVVIKGSPPLRSLHRIKITGFNPFYLTGAISPSFLFPVGL